MFPFFITLDMSNKINAELALYMQSHPGDNFNIIITLTEGADPLSLPLDNYQVLMENILSSTSSTDTIKKLAENDLVVSIEPDIEINFL
jgi:hypothetical protein